MAIGKLRKDIQLLDREHGRDAHHVLASINAFNKQARQAWRETRNIIIPKSYLGVKSIVVNGMGGSRWPLEIVRTVFSNELRIPFSVVSDYDLPAHVKKETLVLLSSYSGTTEEVLNGFRVARKRRAKIIVLTNGGPLAMQAKKAGVPIYRFAETENPSRQPRLGTGYMFFGALGLFERAGLLSLSNLEVDRVVHLIERASRSWSQHRRYRKNKAKQWAAKIHDRIPIIVAAEHLEATAEAFRNRTHENAKHFAIHFPIPGLNHHLLEGFGFPRSPRPFIGLFLNSKLYDRRNQKRINITRTIFERNRIPTLALNFPTKYRLDDAVYSLTFSGYATYWLSILNRVDASAIPWVDYFKAKLAQR